MLPETFSESSANSKNASVTSGNVVNASQAVFCLSQQRKILCHNRMSVRNMANDVNSLDELKVGQYILVAAILCASDTYVILLKR